MVNLESVPTNWLTSATDRPGKDCMFFLLTKSEDINPSNKTNQGQIAYFVPANVLSDVETYKMQDDLMLKMNIQLMYFLISLILRLPQVRNVSQSRVKILY